MMPEICYYNDFFKCPHAGSTFCFSPCPSCSMYKFKITTREVKICYEHEIDIFIEFMKSFDTYRGEGKSHDVTINGHHIYLYEGESTGGGLIHIDKV